MHNRVPGGKERFRCQQKHSGDFFINLPHAPQIVNFSLQTSGATKRHIMADETQPHDNEQDAPTPDLNAQVEYLRGLAKVVAEEGLTELEVESGGLKWTLKTAAPPTYAPTYAAPVVGEGMAAPLYAAPPASVGAAAKPAAKAEEAFTPVVSPMVGVFYRAPSPSDPNFVEIGDRVERGQTIGLVEAMKVFNEIVAESAGTVAKIPVETGQLVETGQPLVLLK